MKNFKDFLIEAEVRNNTDKHDNNPKTKDDNLTFTFGRFNPPHIGHEKLVNAVHGKSKGGDYRIYASQSQDAKKNPLHPEEKMGYMRHMFPDHAHNIHNNANNVFDILKSAHKEGYKSVHIVVGADRVKEFEHLANKYNGSDMYNFNKIKENNEKLKKIEYEFVDLIYIDAKTNNNYTCPNGHIVNKCWNTIKVQKNKCKECAK